MKIEELQEIPETSLLRVKQILNFVRISRSSWYAGVREGRYPQGYLLSRRTRVWRGKDIKALLENLGRT